MDAKRSQKQTKMSPTARYFLRRILSLPPDRRTNLVSKLAIATTSEFELGMLLNLTSPLTLKIYELAITARERHFDALEQENKRLRERNIRLLNELRELKKQKRDNE